MPKFLSIILLVSFLVSFPFPAFSVTDEEFEALFRRVKDLEAEIKKINLPKDLQKAEPKKIGDAVSGVGIAIEKDFEAIANKLVIEQKCSDGFMPLDKIIFKVCYNLRQKVPAWVGYELNPQNLIGSAKRTDNFREDDKLDVGIRSNLSDYKGSGYDRGHMAPAAAFKRSEDAMSTTFLLSNMAPQTPQLNRGVWRIIEEKVRRFASKSGRTIVFTGNYFPTESQSQVIGANKVGVPTHSYKVILHLSTEQKWLAYAFVAPNVKTSLNRDYTRYSTSVDEVEKMTGIDFFESISTELQSVFEANSIPLPDVEQ